MKNMSLNVINDDYLSIENDTLYLNPKRKKKSFSNDYFLLPNKIFSEETNRRMIQIIAKNPTNQIQKQKQNKLKLKALSPRRIPEEEIIKKRKGHILILPLNKNNINLHQKKEKIISNAAKQIIYNKKIREKFLLKIKTKNYNKKISNENNKNEKRNLSDIYDNFKNTIEHYLFEKNKWKNILYRNNDRFENLNTNISPRPNYIEEIEKKYIMPYIMEGNNSYLSFINKRKSTFPFIYNYK